MADFKSLLNTCGFATEFKKLGDLEIDKPYKASNFTFIKTKYGDKLSVLLDEKFRIILPDRFMNVIRTYEELEELNFKTYNMVYNGKKSLNGDRFVHDIKFE